MLQQILLNGVLTGVAVLVGLVFYFLNAKLPEVSIQNAWKTSAVLYAIAQVGFLINIQFPAKHSFDEFHYVPSAKQFIDLKENQNWEHPPLGKEIMAVGIAVFGDTPLGWRFFSTVFAGLTLVGMYLCGLALFGSQTYALQVAGLTLVNHLLYVQARIGMLDTFMMAFLSFALAAFFAIWSRKREVGQAWTLKLLGFAGVMFGLATATKWFAVVPWFFCGGLILMAKLFSSWGVSFTPPASTKGPRKGKGKSKSVAPDTGAETPDAGSPDEEWYAPGLLADLRWSHLIICLGVLPLVAYFACFLPYLFVKRDPAYTLWDLWLMQPRMYDGQLRVVNSHPYMSTWGGWPIMLRPIWYAFEKEGDKDQFVRGVFLLGNPAIMWAGLAAIAYAVWRWLKTRSRQAFLIASFWAVFYLCWGLIPRKIAFYYYYYPAGMVLSFAMVYVFIQLDRTANEWLGMVKWAFFSTSIALFVYFFPILAALQIKTDTFRKWMWAGVRWI